MIQNPLKSPTDKAQINKRCVIILSILYFIALIWVIVFKCNYNEALCVELNRKLSLLERIKFALTAKPFSDLIWSIGAKHTLEILALIGNIFGFIPLGVASRFFHNKPRAFAQCVAIGGG